MRQRGIYSKGWKQHKPKTGAASRCRKEGFGEKREASPQVPDGAAERIPKGRARSSSLWPAEHKPARHEIYRAGKKSADFQIIIDLVNPKMYDKEIIIPSGTFIADMSVLKSVDTEGEELYAMSLEIKRPPKEK